MLDVVDFFFSTLVSVWSLIVTHWILSISVLIMLFNWIIGLVNGSRQDS